MNPKVATCWCGKPKDLKYRDYCCWAHKKLRDGRQYVVGLDKEIKFCESMIEISRSISADKRDDYHNLEHWQTVLTGLQQMRSMVTGELKLSTADQ